MIGLMGLLGIAVGIATFFRPERTAVALVYVVAFWAVALGAIQVITAFRLRRDVAGELWLVIGGLVTIALGLFIAAFPGDGLISLVQILGIWAIFFGLTSLILASRHPVRFAPCQSDSRALLSMTLVVRRPPIRRS